MHDLFFSSIVFDLTKALESLPSQNLQTALLYLIFISIYDRQPNTLEPFSVNSNATTRSIFDCYTESDSDWLYQCLTPSMITVHVILSVPYDHTEGYLQEWKHTNMYSAASLKWHAHNAKVRPGFDIDFTCANAVVLNKTDILEVSSGIDAKPLSLTQVRAGDIHDSLSEPISLSMLFYIVNNNISFHLKSLANMNWCTKSVYYALWQWISYIIQRSIDVLTVLAGKSNIKYHLFDYKTAFLWVTLQVILGIHVHWKPRTSYHLATK